jgi:hypothetical protein
VHSEQDGGGGPNGAFPVIARLTTDPSTIPRMTSKAVARLMKRFLASLTMPKVTT